MHSIDTFEAIVKSNLPVRTHDDFVVTACAWNRQPFIPNQQPGKYAHRMRFDFKFPVSAKGWFNLVDDFRKRSRAEEGGIDSRIHDEFMDDSLYLPFVDFNPMKGGRAETDWWEFLEKDFTGKKFYVFDSGNAQHGVLDRVMDNMTHALWMNQLKNHPQVVDQQWIRYAMAEGGRGVLRTTCGKTRPVPKLNRWVNL